MEGHGKSVHAWTRGKGMERACVRGVAEEHDSLQAGRREVSLIADKDK